MRALQMRAPANLLGVSPSLAHVNRSEANPLPESGRFSNSGWIYLCRSFQAELAPVLADGLGSGEPDWGGELGPSARAYGELIGVSTQAVYGWEKGRFKPRPEAVRRWVELVQSR